MNKSKPILSWQQYLPLVEQMTLEYLRSHEPPREFTRNLFFRGIEKKREEWDFFSNLLKKTAMNRIRMRIERKEQILQEIRDIKEYVF